MTAPKPTLLVVDDEPAIRRVLERAFGLAGFSVVSVGSGEEAIAHLQKTPADAILLDLNMPGISGRDVCRQIRATPGLGNVAILVITGRHADGLPASMLDEGADDYVGKPFDVQELIARVRAVLRRPRVYVSAAGRLQRGELEIDTGMRQVRVQGQPVRMTPKEFELLKLLVSHAPRVVDRHTLMRQVWGNEDGAVNDRSLDVHIRRIRQKIGPLEGALRTVQTIGYQWVDDAIPPSTPA